MPYQTSQDEVTPGHYYVNLPDGVVFASQYDRNVIAVRNARNPQGVIIQEPKWSKQTEVVRATDEQFVVVDGEVKEATAEIHLNVTAGSVDRVAEAMALVGVASAEADQSMERMTVILEDIDPEFPETDLEALTVAKLREVCKELGLKGYSSAKKSDLIAMIDGAS